MGSCSAGLNSNCPRSCQDRIEDTLCEPFSVPTNTDTTVYTGAPCLASFIITTDVNSPANAVVKAFDSVGTQIGTTVTVPTGGNSSVFSYNDVAKITIASNVVATAATGQYCVITHLCPSTCDC
jgi:hypothetical protein